MQPLGSLVLTLSATGIAVFVVANTEVALLQLVASGTALALAAVTIGYTTVYACVG